MYIYLIHDCPDCLFTFFHGNVLFEALGIGYLVRSVDYFSDVLIILRIHCLHGLLM